MNPFMFLNPQNTVNTAMNNAMQNNPQLKKAIDYVNANGGDPKAAFYKLAEEKGVDPESILNQFRF